MNFKVGQRIFTHIHKITEREKLMYDVMCAIATANVPLIYEGAMVTKLILHENNFDTFTRETRDIDASWAGEIAPTMERMTESINNALSGLGLVAIADREYGEKKSAGFIIVDEKDTIELSMDIDMRAAVDKRKYHYGNVTFEGVTPDNIISDKISAISSNMVFRRSKDLVDIYALANPDFDFLYNYLSRFLTPFIEQTEIAHTWDSNKGNWSKDIIRENGIEMPGKKHIEKPSILATIKEGKKSQSLDKNNTSLEKGQERSKNSSPTRKKHTDIDR